MPIGKLGRREPSNRRALEFKDYFRAPALPVFPPVDHLGHVDWSDTMNGNDAVGDCVACMLANVVHLASTVLGEKPVVASTYEVYDFYRTQNPKFNPNGDPRVNGPGSNADGGMEIQQALDYFVTRGIRFGGQLVKALGFAKLDLTLAELRAASSLFGGICIGVDMTTAQEMQWEAERAWDYARGARYVGGHAILGGGHMDKPQDAIRFQCWAARNTMTEEFVRLQVKEAWAVLLPWHLENKYFVDNMNVQAFADAYQRITDRPFPVVVPPMPIPVPVPSPIEDNYAVVAGRKYKLVPV